MSAILKFDFQKSKQLRFSEVNYLNYTKKTQFCIGQLHFPKTKGNKNKPWTHSTPLKQFSVKYVISYTSSLTLKKKTLSQIKVFLKKKKAEQKET